MKKRRGQGKGEDKWNQVPIGEEFLADKEFENLVSFEILTDYNIVKKAGSNKRKTASDSEDFSNGESEDETRVKNEVKKKKLKKRRTEDAFNEEMSVPPIVTTSVDSDSKKKKLKKKVAENKPSVVKAIESTVGESEILEKSEGESENACTPEASASSVLSTSPWKVLVEKSLNDVKPKKKNKRSKKGPSKISNTSDGKKIEETEEHYDICSEEWVKLGVPDAILKALKVLRFERPTTIQSLTLPAALMGKKDIVGAAETGSGKTLAFAIPMINGILKGRNDEDDPSLSNLSGLILTPTRELAAQIKNHIDAISQFADINVMILVGGLSSQKQERLLKTSPDIIVCTPGRLWEMMKEGNEYLSNVNKIRYLAVDETDRMVEKGHFQELQGILGVLNSDPAVCNERQNFVFSATLAFTHEPPERLSKGNVKKTKQPKKVTAKDKLNQIMDMIGVRENPKIVDITSEKGTADSLTEMQITCQLNQKDYYLYYFFLQHPGKTIVFSNSINCVRRLTNLFFHLQLETLPLHSEMHQKQRLRNLERFTENDKGILISTDVAARGLDIKDIKYVIHYQVPKTAESYIHRSGRTARVSKDGLAIILVQPDETTTFWNIFRSLGRDELLPAFEVNSKIFRDLKIQVDLACNVEKFEHMLKKKFADMNWMDKARKDMDLASSDEDSDEDHEGGRGKKRLRKNMEKAKKELDVSKRKLAELMQSNAVHFK